MTSDSHLAAATLSDLVRAFRNYKALGEGAMRQVSDADLHRQLDPDANSLAIIVRHIGGNLRSRFTDFLTSDGEKPDRHRDGEFEATGAESRDEVMRWWNAGWTAALESIDALSPADLDRTIHIRGEAFLVVEALNRSATHTAYHVGQIVMLAKSFAGTNWTSLSIPKGQSAQFGRGSYKDGIIPRRR